MKSSEVERLPTNVSEICRILGLIATAGAGKGELRYVVKRSFGDKRRAVVAVGSELLAEAEA